MGSQRDIDEFLKKIGDIHEVEYGDVKRKVGAYLMRLEESLGHQSSAIKQVMTELKVKLIYRPMGTEPLKYEDLNKICLDWSQKLRPLVKNH